VMLRRVSEEFDVSLPLRTIFTAATVADLAAKVSAESSAR
jgi:acyl carrier protein